MARIRIGSFNVKNLSSKSGRNLTRIAQIINDYKLDIVALQEVLESGRVIYSATTNELSGAAKGYNDMLINHLSGWWDSVWLQPMVRGKNLKYLSPDQRGEGYALLWRKNKFEIPPPVKDSKTGIEEDQGPIIFSGYHAAKDGLRLIRDPLYARLIIKEKKAAELRVLITHFIYGKPSISSDQDDFELDAGAIGMRKKEFHTLAGKIYNRLSKDNNVPECTAPYTLLMGDYNLNLKNSSASGAYVPSSSYEQGLAVAFYDEGGHLVDETSAKVVNTFLSQFDLPTLNGDNANSKILKIYTSQSDLSTLKRDEPSYANNYDHFSFNDTLKRQITSLDGIRAIQEVVGDPDDSAAFEEYKKTVSDHIPIIIELNI